MATPELTYAEICGEALPQTGYYGEDRQGDPRPRRIARYVRLGWGGIVLVYVPDEDQPRRFHLEAVRTLRERLASGRYAVFGPGRDCGCGAWVHDEAPGARCAACGASLS